VLLQVLFALLGLQLLDLVLLVTLSKNFGFWQTLVALFGMGLLGSALARREGRRVWREFQASLAEHRAPEHGVIDGMLVLLGGVLMLLPGLLSDVIGVALCVPLLRRPLAALLRRRLSRELDLKAPQAILGARRMASEPGDAGAPPGAPKVIDTTGVESPE
jgi:UPF0716 protein FxsA